MEHTSDCNGNSYINWLSFASDEGYLGGAIVEACCPVSAIKICHFLKINPGGEVKAAIYNDMPKELEKVILPYKNRLLTKNEAINLAGKIDGYHTYN